MTHLTRSDASIFSIGHVSSSKLPTLRRSLISIAVLLIAAAAFFFLQTQASAGTATLSGTGNWSDPTRWSSSPAGFAPNNGNNGENWSATVTGNTITLDANVIIESLNLNSGAITGASTLTANAASTWTGGNMSGVGGITHFNGPLAITAGSQGQIQRTVNSNGVSSIGNGTFFLQSGAVFNNTASGTLTATISTGLTFSDGTGGSTFNNAGTFHKDGAGTMTFQNQVAFSNTGTVNVNGGILSADGGGTSTGTFDIDSGATFRIQTANYTMNAGALFLGAGTFDMRGGTTTFNAAGTTHTANIAISGGTANFASGAHFTTPGNLTMSAGALTGTNVVTIGGTTTWTGGTMSGLGGITHLNGPLAITAGGQAIIQRTVNSNAAATLTGNGVITMQSGAVFNNTASGTLTATISTGLTFSDGTGGSTFNNAGTFHKDGAGTMTFQNQVAFSNTGTVNVNGGILSADGGGTSTGTFDIDSGATFRIQTANYTMNAGALFLGAGTFDMRGGTTTFNAAGTTHTANIAISGGTANFAPGANFTTPGNLTMNAGGLTGTNVVTIGGATTWTGGNMSGVGGITNLNGPLAITASGQGLMQRTVNSNGVGSIGVNGVFFIQSGAVFNNTASGTFTATTSTALTLHDGTSGSTFANAGTFNKEGPGTMTLQSILAFNNTGTVNVNEGILSADGGGTSTGTFDIDSGATFRIQTANYTMNAGALFLGAGTFDMRGGTTTFNAAGTAHTANVAISGGTASFAAAANFTTAGNLTMSAGALTGTNVVTIGGATAWSGGNMSGVGGITNLNGPLAITASGQGLMQRTVNSNGVGSIGNGLFFMQNGAVFNNTASGTFTATTSTALTLSDGTSGSTFANAGTFNKEGPGTMTLQNLVGFSNTGAVNVNGGTIAASSGVTQHVGTTLTGGTWNVNAGASMNITTGSNITTNQGHVTLSGIGSTFAKIDTLTNNQGSFTIRGGRNFTTAATLTNSGAITAGPGSTLTLGGANNYTQTAGTTLVQGAVAANALNFTGGTLRGTGTVTGPVSLIGASLAPGDSAGAIGALNVVGNVTYGAGSVFDVEIDMGQADQLNIIGDLDLTSLLDSILIDPLDGPFSSPGTYTLITYTGSRIGNGIFDSDFYGGLPMPLGGFAYIDYSTPGEVRLTIVSEQSAVVPEPDMLIPAILGLLLTSCIAWRRRRRS